eukprot:CAMPEP_0181132420 /NCGR_PEP_ID=MMETSP1071-20121207/30984_1 /TAXON_ID=35127 /ORGANISM="Thalassiosira sp., Strain NH16" /LENGTH=443 /DNA_ID=CAMNT_0023218749 /DNA_START=48 /DNA_END=1379 /DNA_ORIENTATION=+
MATDQPRSMFPILKNPTILQIMEEVDVPLTEYELIEPGRCKERVREVFVRLLNICLGLNDPSALTALPSRIVSIQNDLGHPELYDDAFPEAKFFSLLSNQLRICGYGEFGFRDLMAPQAKRFRRQLSAIINFLKYKEDMGHLFAQALEEREELFGALDEVTENHMTLKDHLEEARTINHEKMLEREDAEAECKEMEAEIAQQNKIQSSIRHETSLLKKSANELKDKIANLSIALRELQAEERGLSREVVSSPDRIKLELARVTSELEDVKKHILEKRRERTVVQTKSGHAAAAEEQGREVLIVMEDMETRVSEHEAAVEYLEDVRNALEGATCNLEGRMAQKEGQARRLEEVEQQTSDTASALAGALQTSQNDLDAAKAKLGVVEAVRLDKLARMEESERRIEELRGSIKQKRKDAEREILGSIAKFREFEEGFWAKEHAGLQ